MKKFIILLGATLVMSNAYSQTESFDYTVDKFYDLEILRYQVPAFETLSLQQKTLVYHLTEAALHGRDILYDQNGRYNLRIRRALEALYTQYKGDKTSEEFVNFEKYLKRVWFANGIHHHYASDKFQPEFSQEWFVNACAEAGVTYDEAILPVIFDPTVMPKSLSLEGEDLLLASANNYYEGVTQAEAEAYYEAHKDNSAEPLWIGLNSKLVKENGQVVERVYKVGGMYSQALAKVVEHLEKALEFAENDQQRLVIEKLIEFNKTGNLKAFNEYCIAWVKDLDSRVDFVNGFTETYADPLGITGTWESLINFKDMNATHRCQTISDNAQWFEDNSPTDVKIQERRG
jgi:dipeptidyl-peptidase-3